MRVPHSVFRVIPALLLSLLTAIPLLSQSSATGAKSKSAQDDWDAPTQTAPSPQGSKPGKADTKNVADGAAKGQATEGIVKERDMSSPGKANTKNVADGAAKGQATEGIVKERDMSSPDKVSGDGAAKGQAQELTLTDPNSNGGSGGKGNNFSVSDHKNISDGAAKSQAVDGMAQNPNGGSGGGKGNKSTIKDSKNISDGAAKSQAVDGMAQNPNGGSGGGKGKSVEDHKNIADGAAKGQASDGMIKNPNGGSGEGAGKSDSINYNASKSNTGSFTVHKMVDSASPSVAGKPQPQPGMAVKSQGVPENAKGTKKSATDDWQAPTSATGTTKSKSATDDWQSQN